MVDRTIAKRNGSERQTVGRLYDLNCSADRGATCMCVICSTPLVTVLEAVQNLSRDIATRERRNADGIRRSRLRESAGWIFWLAGETRTGTNVAVVPKPAMVATATIASGKRPWWQCPPPDSHAGGFRLTRDICDAVLSMH